LNTNISPHQDYCIIQDNHGYVEFKKSVTKQKAKVLLGHGIQTITQLDNVRTLKMRQTYRQKCMIKGIPYIEYGVF